MHWVELLGIVTLSASLRIAILSVKIKLFPVLPLSLPSLSTFGSSFIILSCSFASIPFFFSLSPFSPHASFHVLHHLLLLFSSFFELQLFFGCPTYHFTTFVPCSLFWDHLLLSTAHLFPQDNPPSPPQDSNGHQPPPPSPPLHEGLREIY